MKQKGSALIIVLLLLVLMILMSFALMRSSDLAAMITGNMANKLASIQAGDVGLIAAEKQLENIVDGGTDSAYSATVITAITNKNYTDETITWSNAVEIDNKLRYQYFIDRISDDFYRITIKISGQRNSESYFEALYSTQ